MVDDIEPCIFVAEMRSVQMKMLWDVHMHSLLVYAWEWVGVLGVFVRVYGT
jgi:hypothetical protein